MHVLFSQKECILPEKKETENEKSAKPKKKRKVSVTAPTVAKSSLRFICEYYMNTFCFLEEEDDYRCLAHIKTETRLSSRSTETDHRVLLRQAVCD